MYHIYLLSMLEKNTIGITLHSALACNLLRKETTEDFYQLRLFLTSFMIIIKVINKEFTIQISPAPY